MRHSCSENRNRILTATVSVIYCVSVLSFTQKWMGGIHMKPILNIENLTKVYGTLPNQTRALNGITFQVMSGEFLGIMGSSGSGKSTLLNCIATVIQPTGGAFRWRAILCNPSGERLLQSTVAKKLVIYSRTLNCWTT